jgi:sarcosine oxidase subunit alpha
MSAGWTPSVHMYSQSRGKVVWDEESQRFLPGDYPQDAFPSAPATARTGCRDVTEAQSPRARRPRRKRARRRKSRREDQGRRRGVLGRQHDRRRTGRGPGKVVKAFVDFQNDVTAKDIRLAVQEGMHSIEHVKRFTTNGMATDQGKLSNLHGLAIAAECWASRSRRSD